MAGNWNQHIGDDQLVYGMPKHMSAGAGSGKPTKGDKATYWRYHPKPQACDKCQAMKGLWFEEKPDPVHPNCKCEIEEFEAIKVTGRSEAIIVPPGVDLVANIAEARRVGKECQEKAALGVDEFLSRISLSGVNSIHKIRKTLIDELTFLYKCLWIYEKFNTGKKYDFKKNNHPEYEDFGNYHYGLYTKAMGINVDMAQAGAGAAQLAAGTYKIRWYRTWFDDPHDNQMIRRGQGYPF